MKKILAVMVTIMLAGMMLAAGCADKSADKEAVKDVLRANLKALQAEDLDGYLATLDPDSPGYEKMKLICPKIFEIYDLEHEVEKIEVLDISDQEARVRTVQVARRISGPDSYRHNRSTTVHTLKKKDGAWKLTETEQESMEYLE
ncbi:MAG: hypothetical protein ACLFPD_06870 [Desulfosudaceae bacterium]